MCLRRRSRLNVYKRVRLNAGPAGCRRAAGKSRRYDGRDTDEKLAQAGIGATNKSNARMCWRVYSVNKANNTLYVDGQNLPASFVRTDWPALLGLFIRQYLLCYR